MVLCCEKFDTLHGKAVNALHQRFSRNIIFTATTLDLKHILSMDSIVFLGGREASTLKDISENWLGKATISMQTEGRSRGQSESYSQNMQRLGRELMTTSEITTMPGDKCILQLRGLPPFLSPKYDLKKHPNYKYTAEFDKKKNAFRLESLFRHRPLRLKPEDEYTVYEVDGSDTDEEADLLNFDDLDSDEFV